MKISRERLEKLARDLVDGMGRSKAVIFQKDRESIRLAIAQAILEEIKREEEREEKVRRRLATMKTPKRGSAEWEILFRKLMEEEYVREGLDT